MNEEAITHADLDLFYSKVDGALKSHQRFFREELELFEKKLEAIEQQVATITVGFAEQAVLVEALIAQLEYTTEERQEAFKNKVLATRDLMLETLEYTADVLEDGDTGAEQPVEDVVEKTDLYITENNVGLLVVNDEEYEIYNSLELLSNTYSVAKKMYPQLASIIVLQGEIYKLLQEEVVEIHDVKVIT